MSPVIPLYSYVRPFLNVTVSVFVTVSYVVVRIVDEVVKSVVFVRGPPRNVVMSSSSCLFGCLFPLTMPYCTAR